MCLQRKRKNHFYELNTMKHNWEYKKLKEVCQKGSSNIQQNKIAEITGNYPVYGASGFVQNIDFYHQEKPYIGIVKDGSGVGRVNIYPAQTSLLGTMQYILPNDKVLLGYLAYCLQSLELSKFASGAAIPHIYFRDYGESFIPLPPLPIQQKIVAELDKVCLIIEKKKQQLKELDNLAQAIFYDMFGDPVENEKGWEVKKWEDLFDTRLGKMLDAKHQIASDASHYYLGNSNVQWGYFDLKSLNTMTFSKNEEQKFELKYGDLLVCEGGESGRCAVWLENCSEIKYQKAIHRARCKDDSVLPIFVRYFMQFLKIGGGLKDYISKSTIEHLTGEKLNKVPIILPPLALQQSFAAKIEAIEKQKELISRSIKEAQTLFDERMDYWFD